MSRRSRGPSAQKLVTSPATAVSEPVKTQKRGNVELFMECVDEDLAPSQKEAERKAETEYKTAMKRVKTAKSAVVSPRSAAGAVHVNGEPTSVTPGRGRGRELSIVNSATGGRGRGRRKTQASTALGKILPVISCHQNSFHI